MDNTIYRLRFYDSNGIYMSVNDEMYTSSKTTAIEATESFLAVEGGNSFVICDYVDHETFRKPDIDAPPYFIMRPRS